MVEVRVSYVGVLPSSCITRFETWNLNSGLETEPREKNWSSNTTPAGLEKFGSFASSYLDIGYFGRRGKTNSLWDWWEEIPSCTKSRKQILLSIYYNSSHELKFSNRHLIISRYHALHNILLSKYGNGSETGNWSGVSTWYGFQNLC